MCRLLVDQQGDVTRFYRIMFLDYFDSSELSSAFGLSSALDSSLGCASSAFNSSAGWASSTGFSCSAGWDWVSSLFSVCLTSSLAISSINSYCS